MNKYQALFRIRFTNSLQYRSAAFAGMVTQFVWGMLEIFAFRAFYQTDPAAFPMTFQQTVSYVWMQQAFLALFMLWFFENEIFDAIASGAIAYELSRPMDLYNRWFCQSAANRCAKALLRCLPIFAIVFLLPVPYRLVLPENLMSILLFMLSLVLSLGVVVAVSMLIYISTFYTLSSLGVRVVMGAIGEFLAGAIIPLPFFPQPFRQIAELLPFATMQNVPLRIYSGDLVAHALWQMLGMQLFWLVVLVAGGKFWMARALKRVIVQGG
ncbi:ABC transporter permease [Enterococcus gallinarum]|uniref:ABC transporter permease n=1 Tax=Enterococcus gallinarum TaxID=1353 RepID=UPI001AD73A45|nr:ABC transporter permease [Enterococcus gallinarum]MBO6326057.1 ABC transporter permease [Enterococcus gallinarum]